MSGQLAFFDRGSRRTGSHLQSHWLSAHTGDCSRCFQMQGKNLMTPTATPGSYWCKREVEAASAMATARRTVGRQNALSKHRLLFHQVVEGTARRLVWTPPGAKLALAWPTAASQKTAGGAANAAAPAAVPVKVEVVAAAAVPVGSHTIATDT